MSTEKKAEQKELSVNDAVTLMAQILSELRAKDSVGDERLSVLSKGVEALVSAEATRPRENRFPPEISYLNPLGERDNPRPELKCKMFWVGYKLSKEVLTKEEIDLLNKIQPGSYRVHKSDGRSIPFVVAAKDDESGRLEKLSFHFPCKNRDDRQNHMPMASYLREALGDVRPDVDRLLEQVQALQAELATRPQVPNV
jgi:hypothetical protein